MRRYGALLLVPVAAISLAALVGALRGNSAPRTPGAVVEEFLRHVIRDRYEKAATFLAGGAGRSATPDALRAWRVSVEEGLGEVRRARGKTDWISGNEAEATGTLVADRRERRLRFGLERVNGQWRISRLDEFWGRVPGPTSSIRVREPWRLRARSRSTLAKSSTTR